MTEARKKLIEEKALSLLLSQRISGEFALSFLDLRRITTGGAAVIDTFSSYEKKTTSSLPTEAEGITVKLSGMSLILYDDRITNAGRRNWTIAHELGHAYHGLMIQDHRPLNTGYTMPVAETASNFNELIIVNDAIAKSEGEEKIQLIESQLQDCTQIIVDIYSRFLFEDEVIRRRKNTFLFAKDLEEIMINAQKEAYGDGLDPETLHPYMWCCKSHYFSAGLSYYNFPYAFGGLFARGLYARYEQEGADFLPKYKKLLYTTTIASAEDTARVAGIDLTDKEFWRSALQVIADQIDLFCQLVEE